MTVRSHFSVTTRITHSYSVFVANKGEVGGLSGKPLKPLTLRALKILRAHLPASIPIIGCGGISSGADALEYGRAGASFVQLYTEFGYNGVGTCRRVKDELASLLRAEGKTWSDVVQESVGALSLQAPRGGEATIENLIEEAQELKSLLDKLGDKIGGDS